MLKMCYFGAVGRERAWYARGHGFESQRVRAFWQHTYEHTNAAQHTHIRIAQFEAFQ